MSPSAFFAAQAAQPGLSIAGSLWACRRLLGKSVRAVPYWREDGKRILRYMVPVLIWTIATTIAGNVDMLLIRHRLSEFESAGFYIISRFSEIAACFGSAFTLLLFPKAAASGKKDASSLRLIRHTVVGCAVSGILVTGLLAIGGDRLLSLTSTWRPYVGLSREMTLLALNSMLGIILGCLVSFEMAQGRFRFLRYLVPILAIKATLLFCLCGFTFFDGILPSAVISACEALNPNRLSFLVASFLAFNVVCVAFISIDVFIVRSRLN